MKIAVSGDIGSFSEEAGLLYAQRQGWSNPEMIFAIDMDGVLRSVSIGEADCGVFPVVNSRGGLVQTAFDAMGKYIFTMVDELWFEVYQCLLALPGVKKEEIETIVSHPQAISQCERYIKREFPNVKLVDWEDTAKAAKDLSAGILSCDTAVIAPARSAQIYGLELLDRGIQDNHPNLTTFIIVKR